MSDDPFQIPSHVEQDQYGGDNLPSYTDLAQQTGPNSRQLLESALVRGVHLILG